MKETPIIMSGDLPFKIMRGQKTMTRRTKGLKEINEEPDAWEIEAHDGDTWVFRNKETWVRKFIRCPYGQVGDELWVKETWAINVLTNKPMYKADFDDSFEKPVNGWKPSIFMSRWASRISLQITELRAERLQEIWMRDAIAEGCSLDFDMAHFGNYTDPISKFQELWDSLNAKRGYAWEKNPWVWVIAFGVIGVRLK